MAFDLHPILSPGQKPTLGLWYAVSPEYCEGALPAAKVGACANFQPIGDGTGRILLSAGATPEGPYSDLHQLVFSRGKYYNYLLCNKWHAHTHAHAHTTLP